MPSSATPERWTWPHGRAIVLYHWSWFDQMVGDVVVGWSQRDEVDDHGYIHLEEETHQSARTRQLDRESRDFAVVEPHTFTSLTPLPASLVYDDGTPIAWLRTLLGTH
jgi:hypothetical protein